MEKKAHALKTPPCKEGSKGIQKIEELTGQTRKGAEILGGSLGMTVFHASLHTAELCLVYR